VLLPVSFSGQRTEYIALMKKAYKERQLIIISFFISSMPNKTWPTGQNTTM
jgi:hypothetical protein